MPCRVFINRQVYVLETFLAGQVVHRLPHLFSQATTTLLLIVLRP